MFPSGKLGFGGNLKSLFRCLASIVFLLAFVRRLAHNGFTEGRCEQSRLVFNGPVGC